MRTRLPKASFVYLTADTEEELLEIKADEIYIIGGICDHNRYKASRSTPHAFLLLAELSYHSTELMPQ